MALKPETVTINGVDYQRIQGVPMHDETNEDADSIPDLQDNDAQSFLNKVAHYVDSNNLSKHEEIRYYKKCARRVRLIMTSVARHNRRDWREVLNMLRYNK